MEWISVEDEKPKENDCSLENDCSFIITDGTLVGMGYWDVDGFVGIHADILNDITHWMPFPSPPIKIALGRHDFPISNISTEYPNGN